MKNEAALSKWINPILPGFSFRIETSTLAGVPDIYGLFEGISYWVELKCTETVNRKPRLGNHQKAWSRKARKHGGVVLVVAADKTSDKIRIYQPRGYESLDLVGTFDKNVIGEITFVDAIKLAIADPR